MTKTAILVAGTFLVLSLASLAFGEPGNLTGKVIDAKTKSPLPFANIVIVDTPYGAMSMDDGSFFMRNIPEGTYTVRASYMGYEPEEIEGVVIEVFETTETNFNLIRTVIETTDEVLVTAERPMVEVDVPSTVRSVDEDQIREMPVTDIQDVMGLQAGVVQSDDEIHIRGGRSDETLYIIDGVQMKDLVSGSSSAIEVSAKSVAEMDVITGGYSAEYGQALSGVVNVKLKEGGSKHHGYMEYSGDHLAFTDSDWKTSFMTDRFEVGFDGPEPVSNNLLPRMGVRIPGQVTYFVGFSGRYTDTHLPNINDIPGAKGLVTSYEDRFLGMNFTYQSLAPRAENNTQLFGKLVWRPSSKNKFGLSFTKAISIDQGYFRYDPYDVTRNLTGYQHAWSRHLDSALVYTGDSNSLVLSWTQFLSQTTYHQLKLSRFFTLVHADVAGKHWTEYTMPNDEDLWTFDEDGNRVKDADTPYFIETGNADLWHDRYGETYTAAWDITKQLPPHHQVKGGFNASYENIQYIFIRQPWVSDPDSLGEFHDIFHIYPNRGYLYVTDKIRFEGLIGEIGLRYDYWFPGKQVQDAVADTSNPSITQTTRDNFYRDTNEIFGYRFKGHLSPRVAISHPITDRDNLFFNYGHFTQIPSYIWIYSKLSSVSSEVFPLIGNPALNPEVSVQYEIGARHQFTPTLAANVTLFYKDIYDYPTSTAFEKPGVGEMFIYRNLDYARSRGIEVELRMKRSHRYGGSLVYTYSLATGKSSDPNTLKLIQEQGGDVGTREASLAEEYLWWNRPHKFNLNFNMNIVKGDNLRLFGLDMPTDWNLNIQWLLQSGRAYTPTLDGQEMAKRYSENGPMNNVIDLRFTKYLGAAPLKYRLYLQVDNVFNTKTVRRVDSETGEAPVAGVGSYDYEISPGTSPEDAARQIEGTNYRATNPNFWGRPRQIVLGLGMEW
ncbi:MAG: TonB-dependent receptor [bacterium]|jgi:outer membrane receptor protein involved in Fe transport